MTTTTTGRVITGPRPWQPPLDIAEAERRIADGAARVAEIQGQLARAKEDPERLSDEAWRERRAWRARAVAAAQYTAADLSRLRAWLKAARAAAPPAPATLSKAERRYRDLRRGRYLLHRVVEEAALPPALLAEITAFLADGGEGAEA